MSTSHMTAAASPAGTGETGLIEGPRIPVLTVQNDQEDMAGKPEEPPARNHDDLSTRSGKHTPHFHDGRNVARTLRWLGETEKYVQNQ